MKIGIDYTSAIAQWAGIGRYTRSLVDALLREVRDDSLSLFSTETPTAERGFPDDPHVASQVWRAGGRVVGNRAATIIWHRLRVPLPYEAVGGRVDVLHGPDFVLPPAMNTPRVATIHDLAYLTHPQFALPSLVKYLSASVPRSLRRASRVIAVSERTAQDLAAHYGIPRSRMTVIPLGVNLALRPVTDQDRLRDLDARYRLAHPLVLAVGTIEPRKDYARLIEAFARARTAAGGPKMLAIAGREGWLYDGVFRAVEEHGVGDVVRFLSFVPEADLATLYSTADVLAMPSVYEGFGIPVLEAMACGTPVLCSDGGSLPEVAGDAAMVVAAEDTPALTDGLVRAVSDMTLRAELRERGIARAAGFTWAETARRHLEVYHEVAGRRGVAR